MKASKEVLAKAAKKTTDALLKSFEKGTFKSEEDKAAAIQVLTKRNVEIPTQVEETAEAVVEEQPTAPETISEEKVKEVDEAVTVICDSENEDAMAEAGNLMETEEASEDYSLLRPDQAEKIIALAKKVADGTYKGKKKSAGKADKPGPKPKDSSKEAPKSQEKKRAEAKGATYSEEEMEKSMVIINDATLTKKQKVVKLQEAGLSRTQILKHPNWKVDPTYVYDLFRELGLK